MSLRIPAPVNRLLDVLARHPAATACTVIVLFPSSGLALLLVTWWAPALIAALALVDFAVTYHLVTLRLWKDRAQQAESDLGIAVHRIAVLEAGDPDSPTAQLHVIGGRGEGT